MPISGDVICGHSLIVHHPELVNLYGCTIGDDTRIGAFVEIQKNATIGARCKVSSHTFVCEGVTIEDDVFIGHGVVFINDRYPCASANGRPQTEADWLCIPTLVRRGASIGSGAVVMCGVTIGEHALVGAGAVVCEDVPDYAVVLGVPARFVRDMRGDAPATASHRQPLAARSKVESSREEVTLVGSNADSSARSGGNGTSLGDGRWRGSR